MNVAIIGKGTAAIITSLHLIKNGHDVTVFYDPKTPHINVGESTTAVLGNLIWDTLGITVHDLVDYGICSYKMGIEFVNWGEGKKFHHNFINNAIAFHFETGDFNKFIHKYLEEKNLVTYIPQRVDDIPFLNGKLGIHGLEYDFMINCSGWSNNDEYFDPIFETVNSAVLFKKQYPEYGKQHTLHLATEDGWQFGLPFPEKNIFKCGYLYNSAYTSKDEVLKKLPSDAVVYENYSWKPRYSKKLIKNPLVAYNGNRLFFFEPLQAMTLHYTNEFAIMICDYLSNREQSEFDRINQLYLDYIYSQQICLAYHYQFGSIYDTKFWQDKTKRSKIIMNNSVMGRGERFLESMKCDIKYGIEVSKLAWMLVEDHIYIHNGMASKEWVGLKEHSLPSIQDIRNI